MGRFIYFETSAWNRLAERRDRTELVEALQRTGDQIFASVITVGEILGTAIAERRRLLCEVMEGLHGPVAPILDHPEYLARYAANAWLRGESSVEIRQSRGASVFLRYLMHPETIAEEERQEVEDWVRAMDDDQARVFEDLADVGPRLGPKFCSAESLEHPRFNQIFADKIPVPRELGLTGQQVAELTDASDIWKAYRAGVAFTIDAALDRMPPTRPGSRRQQKRPGGPDVRQAIYLGVCEIFVLKDGWLGESLTEIAEAAGLQRRIVTTDEFFDETLSAAKTALRTAVRRRGHR